MSEDTSYIPEPGNATAEFLDKLRIDGILEKAQNIINYRFLDRELLVKALTHPSAVEFDAIENSYERLEFLGDSLLGAFIAMMIYERFPHFDEGAMTRIKMSLVSGGTLSKVSAELGFADLIIFGSSEKGTGKRGLASALENVFEAITAAIALDGGVKEAQKWVLYSLGSRISSDFAAKKENPKSKLQEILQVDHITPTYELVSSAGPPHDRTFTCNVLAAGDVIGTGEGSSKKEAEVEAASIALKSLEYL